MNEEGYKWKTVMDERVRPEHLSSQKCCRCAFLDELTAEQIGKLLEAALSMRIDEGKRLIKHLDSLIERYKKSL